LKNKKVRTTPFDQYFLDIELCTTPFRQYFLGFCKNVPNRVALDFWSNHLWTFLKKVLGREPLALTRFLPFELVVGFSPSSDSVYD
jgi:hypothetical protein